MTKDEASIIAKALDGLMTGVRSATMFDAALRDFRDACQAQDWVKAEALRVAAQETLNAWLDAIVAVHRRE